MSIITLTAENFDKEVINSPVPVLVDFWAAWCGPCRMLSPIVDEIAEEVSGIKVAKVNIDEQPDIARRYRIMSIPTLMLFKNGEVAEKLIGVQPKELILDILK